MYKIISLSNSGASQNTPFANLGLPLGPAPSAYAEANQQAQKVLGHVYVKAGENCKYLQQEALACVATDVLLRYADALVSGQAFEPFRATEVGKLTKAYLDRCGDLGEAKAAIQADHDLLGKFLTTFVTDHLMVGFSNDYKTLADLVADLYGRNIYIWEGSPEAPTLVKKAIPGWTAGTTDHHLLYSTTNGVGHFDRLKPVKRQTGGFTFKKKAVSGNGMNDCFFNAIGVAGITRAGVVKRISNLIKPEARGAYSDVLKVQSEPQTGTTSNVQTKPQKPAKLQTQTPVDEGLVRSYIQRLTHRVGNVSALFGLFKQGGGVIPKSGVEETGFSDKLLACIEGPLPAGFRDWLVEQLGRDECVPNPMTEGVVLDFARELKVLSDALGLVAPAPPVPGPPAQFHIDNLPDVIRFFCKCLDAGASYNFPDNFWIHLPGSEPGRAKFASDKFKTREKIEKDLFTSGQVGAMATIKPETTFLHMLLFATRDSHIKVDNLEAAYAEAKKEVSDLKPGEEGVLQKTRAVYWPSADVRFGQKPKKEYNAFTYLDCSSFVQTIVLLTCSSFGLRPALQNIQGLQRLVMLREIAPGDALRIDGSRFPFSEAVKPWDEGEFDPQEVEFNALDIVYVANVGDYAKYAPNGNYEGEWCVVIEPDNPIDETIVFGFGMGEIAIKEVKDGLFNEYKAEVERSEDSKDIDERKSEIKITHIAQFGQEMRGVARLAAAAPALTNWQELFDILKRAI